ncbi:hypothetical protein [Halalkalibacter alkalisediminis]|uniref:Lipoprotein n=1 Tax=Halalkalibacter alkalisediminis TaxID=935616 RepID=A0ABV6NC09_9BACI|nr:hypothetical protein [Halalkalibacter alkalisediminis]
MKQSILFLMCLLSITGCDTLLTAGGGESERLREITLSENEQVIFSLLADELFYIEYMDRSKQFRSLEIGVDYFHYGELSEESGGITLAANNPDFETEDDRARFLFTMDWEASGDSPSVQGEMIIFYDSGTTGSSSYSFSRPTLEQGGRTRGYLLEQIDKIPYGEKLYVAYLAENVNSNSMKTFDLEQVTTPNDEYEHVYLYYVMVNQES